MKFILAFLIISFSSYAASTDWETTAQIDMNTPAGKVYEQVVAKFTADQLGNIISACIGNEMPREFTLYFKILSNGSVSETYSTLSTPDSNCFSNKMASLIWPSPPASPFVFKINMFGSV